MIRLTQQHHQPAHNLLDLAVIHEADHHRNMDYVISAYQFLWWVLKDIMLGYTDGRRKPRRGRALR